MSHLIISRSRGEKTVIVVPPSTKPTRIIQGIVAIRGGTVREEFIAPKSTTIHRQEVQDEIDRENAEKQPVG